MTAQLPGVIRRFWRAAPSYTGAPRAFNWTDNAFDASSPGPNGPLSTRLNWRQESPVSGILHYGNQLSRPMSRPMLTPSVAAARPRQRYAGNMARNRPVLRVRIPSYGSRVPALNSGGAGTLE